MIAEPTAAEVLNASEAAIYLHVDRKTLRRLIRRRVIPFRRIGRVYRFSRCALQEWLRGQKI